MLHYISVTKQSNSSVQGLRSPLIHGTKSPDQRIQKTTRNKFSWFLSSGWRDLNPRPLDPQSSALPSCATARIQFVAVATCRTIAHLAKERQADLRAPRHTRGTKGSRWILPTLHVRKTEQVSRRAGGDNTIPCPHNMHPRESFQ